MFELHLGKTEVAEPCKQPERCVHGVLHPDRLADATGPDAGRDLPELPAAEDAERPTVARDIAADRVERVVAAGNELLHHRRELFRARIGLFDLGERLATKRLPAKAQLEADRMLGLDEHRQTDVLRGSTGFPGGA